MIDLTTKDLANKYLTLQQQSDLLIIKNRTKQNDFYLWKI